MVPGGPARGGRVRLELGTFPVHEARFGQHGTLTRVWARVGSRPPAIRQTQYDYLYVFSAVCPETGEATGLITPHVNTDAMNAFLAQFAAELPPEPSTRSAPQSAKRSMPSHPRNAPTTSKIQAIELNAITL